MEKKVLNDKQQQNKELANGKSSKDCSHEELVSVYRAGIPNKETDKERLDRINAFRCGF